MDTDFELLPTDGAFINASMHDLFMRQGMMIEPAFKQMFRASSFKRQYYTALIAATIVDIFPVNIRVTLYLVPEPDGFNVPIAYAYYAPP
jgi:hypothetical protein